MSRIIFSIVLFVAVGSILQARGDESVPVPGGLQEPIATSITVSGQAGASQSDATVRIIRQYVGLDGSIERATGSTAPAHELGEQVAIEPGKYMVSYSGSSVMIDVIRGEHKQIELKKLFVPKVDRAYKVQVFPDFTNRDQQLQRVLFTWLTPQAMTFHCYTYNDWGRITDTWDATKSLQTACDKTKSQGALARRYCSSYTGTNYEDLIENFFKFHNDGTYSTVKVDFSFECGDESFSEASESMLELGRITIAHGVDGDFFSLMPGVYGTKITNHSGKSSVKLGVLLQ